MYANLYPFKLGLWCVYFLGIVTGTRESESSSRLSQQVVALQFQSWMACHLGVPQIPFHWMKWRTRISISRCLDIQKKVCPHNFPWSATVAGPFGDIPVQDSPRACVSRLGRCFWAWSGIWINSTTLVWSYVWTCAYSSKVPYIFFKFGPMCRLPKVVKILAMLLPEPALPVVNLPKPAQKQRPPQK